MIASLALKLVLTCYLSAAGLSIAVFGIAIQLRELEPADPEPHGPTGLDVLHAILVGDEPTMTLPVLEAAA